MNPREINLVVRKQLNITVENGMITPYLLQFFQYYMYVSAAVGGNIGHWGS